MKIMTLDEIKQFFDDNAGDPEVKAYLESINPVTSDRVKGYLETDAEGKKVLESLTDARVTKGIETFKQNNLDKMVEAKYNELHPAETEDQKRLRLLEQQFNDEKKAREKAELKAKALGLFNAKKLNPDMIDLFSLGSDESALQTNVERLAEIFNANVKSIVDDTFKGNGRDNVPQGNKNSKTVNPWKKETFNLTQQGQIFKEKPELARAMMKEAGVQPTF